jgi:hypothetical protein
LEDHAYFVQASGCIVSQFQHRNVPALDGYDLSILQHAWRYTVSIMNIMILLLDVLILFIELFLQATFPSCHIIERDAISCCPASERGLESSDLHCNETSQGADAGSEAHDFRRFLLESSSATGEHTEEHGHHNLCAFPSVESHEYNAVCDPHKYSAVHTTEKALFGCTVFILSTLLVELIIMMIVVKKAFFTQFSYVLDSFIVVTSLAMEITFQILESC